MVKSRFPGKPAKHFNRRKVSGVNSVDTDSIKVVRDSILSLSYFNYLFNRNEEDNNSFHGFSPHDGKPDKKNTAENSRKRKRANLSPKKPALARHKKNNLTPSDNAIPVAHSSNYTECDASNEITVSQDLTDTNKTDPKDDMPSNPTLSGKFVLPSRSAHSSRVIKPNKRFLHNDTSSTSKKPRIMNFQESLETTSTSELSDDGPSAVQYTFGKRRGRAKKSDTNGNSSVKFVLRKPRLKIKSQSLPTVGGPFSSPGGNSLSLQGTKYQSPSVKKVFCGVCGSMRTFIFFQQVRKFGIFSCLPCRKFIVQIIRSERKDVLKPLSCTSGLGNCPIRQNTLAAQCFSNDALENTSNENDRCEACWLNLCLHSFHISQKLMKRLTTFLPQILQKSFNNTGDSSETNNTFGNSTEQSTANSNNETRIIKKNKGIRESINIRRGSSNTALRLSSHRGREEVKRGRGRPHKVPVAGPRIKHVCRSASLVLGQPAATFHPGSTKAENNSECSEDLIKVEDDNKSSDEIQIVIPTEVSDKDKRIPEIETELQIEENDFDYPPIARMLQDLGRANCELLDGMENHEHAKLNARVSIDFWESYDPEEVIQMGFPLIGFNPLRLRSVCFLCGSAGLEKMIHCASCCEPYHTFCVSNKMNPNPSGDWWRLDWLCPKCTQCEACQRTGGSQTSCAKCHKSYHSNCISTARINICDNNWVCPDCLFCKSCNDSTVHVFVGNMPLCKACFKLRQKGNFCPLCQCCYDENDYNSKMMECAECKCWIHAQCEGISNEKYQVLSYLPPTIEFICRLCCKDPPAHWTLAVEAELKAGYLNVIKILSKNKNACAMFKASPKKQRVCVCLDKLRNPIHLSNLMSSERDTFGIDSLNETSPDRDYKSSDYGLLTPKLTKDDEESLKTVKSDFLNLVTAKNESNISGKPLNNRTNDLSSEKNSQLLTIDYGKLEGSNEISLDNSSEKTLKEKTDTTFQEKTCSCQKLEASAPPTLTLLTVKTKAASDEYHSVVDFHNDMERVTNDIGNSELIETYKRCLKQIFPWFDPNLDESVSGPILTDVDMEETKKLVESPKHTSDVKSKKQQECFALKGLLNLEQAAYYIGIDYGDTRTCLLCKKVGEGLPKKEGRLLYCGQNEWVHTNCAIWSSEVFEEIDGSLQNVYSAISRARLIRCSHCNKKGASLGCCAKSCPSAYHFGCAFSAECIFLESKEVYCKVHYSFRGDRETHKEEDFFIKRSVYVELDHKKLKDVLRSQVKVYIGSLEVNQLGDILPDLSDNLDVIIPCDYWCSRLFWSCKEPWKIVRYNIKTKITNTEEVFSYEIDTNYTVDHSLEFTPPPSPIDSLSGQFSPDVSERDIKSMVNHIIETICSKEEEGNLSDQQSTDLLPPELTDVIYDDLPKDFLDRITVNDIFTKMSFDDLLSESKVDKNDNADGNTNIEPFCSKLNLKTNKSKGRNNQFLKVVNVIKPKGLEKIKECQVYLDREHVNKWKRQSILQVDGAMDLSESDQSNDSCDIEIKSEETDEPVKCVRCRRTYRTSLSYERHLPTCNSEYLSCSESDLSEEEKTQGIPEDNTVKTENVFLSNSQAHVAIQESQHHVFSVPIEGKSILTNEQKVHLVQNTFENAVVCVNNSNVNGLRESTGSLLNVNYTTLNNDTVTASFPTEQTLVTTSVDRIVSDQMVGLQQPTIILQQMSSENVMSSPFIQSAFQESQQPNIQYITAINTQEKTQYLTAANTMGSTTYHIQPQIPQPLVQNVPTVVGTIVQSNGVEQIVLNNPSSSLDVYGQQQNNMYIANTPMIVGMETVVSNTVMQSSRFITGTPGMLASSYSATTTQVFQAAKPMMDIPQGYVVVNTNPPSIIENNSCVQNIIQNGTMANPTWNNYKINYHDAIKLNKNLSCQSVAQHVLSNKANVNGLKMIDTNIIKENPPALVQPIHPSVKFQQMPAITDKPCNSFHAPPSNNYNAINKQSNTVKIVELPSSSANHKEKPQQAVAPVVIKKVPEPEVERPITAPICNGILEVVEEKETAYETPQIKSEESKENKSLQSSIPIKNPNVVDQPTPNKKENLPSTTPIKANVSSSSTSKKEVTSVSSKKTKEQKDLPEIKVNGSDNIKKRKVQEEPKISFEISTEDGFYFNTTSLEEAWNKVYETVQNSRKSKNLPLLTRNPFSSPDTMLKKMMGLNNNSMKYLLEQLPGIGSCSKYKPVYHKKAPSALEKELYRGKNLNPSGCARTEKFKHAHKTYDMFSWLASRHRRPPKLIYPEFDGLNGNSRRATSMSLPMAMRFRHLKITSKHSVGVFRSDIHGRGLFCLRDIDSGEMVIEYAGEVIRSALTDKRERYYTEKGIGCYMFRIDDKSVVDATMKGNAARFINHSCEPNCYSRVIDILGKKHILIFALRKIVQGEELTYDYKFPLEEDKINCHCLSRKCRKYLN